LDDAVTSLRLALSLGATDPFLHYGLADALLRLNDLENAEVHATAAAAASEQLPFAPALLIRVLHYQGKLDEAIEYSRRVLENGDGGPNFYGALASVYFDADDSDAARHFANLALEANSSDADAKLILATLDLGSGNATDSVVVFDELLDRNPENGRAWLGKGLAQMLGGTLPAAAESLTKATIYLDNHLGTLNTLAWVHLLNKDVVEAERALDAAQHLDRNFAETHGALAVAALMRGNIDSAVQAAKRAHALDKKNFAGNFAESLIQQANGNATAAQQIMQNILNSPITANGETLQVAIARAMAGNIRAN
jgi:tetratricopeptide (TPR) repeat protein